MDKKITILLSLFFICPFIASAATSTDAIGLRVVSNNGHYSAYRWYTEQGFDGSPQSIMVDGYEAVRDGRTVYVNAANIDDKDTFTATDDAFYTNIYIISYNQSAESATVDIFGQMLLHWKFNINLTDPDVCSQSSGIACLVDNDCPLGEYCLSQKAKIARDTKRLGDIAEIKFKMADLGYYSELLSGSYLPGRTLSVWPSWQDNLSQELGVVLPVDPINKLGQCEGYNEITCWNDDNKTFAGAIPGSLPDNSFVYAYYKIGEANFNVCAFMESDVIDGTEDGVCVW